MDINVRLASAQDRTSLDEFYKREGMDFQDLSARPSSSSIGAARETMYIIAVSGNMVVAALKLDIVKDPGLGNVGYILHFEIEDELENTNLGHRMIEKTVEIAKTKSLRALNASINEERSDVISIFLDTEFHEVRKDVCLRRDFRERIF
ncbi:MAG: hypothetical protein ACFFD6_10230 [Candidatus Thorarchaeota archaeon]